MKALYTLVFFCICSCLFAQEATLFPFRSCDKWGFADANRKVVIPVIYDSVGFFHNGIAWVKEGDLFGYLNIQGRMITRIEFEKAGDFSYGQARVGKEGKIFSIDVNGQEAKPMWRCGNSDMDDNVIGSKITAYKENGKQGLKIVEGCTTPEQERAGYRESCGPAGSREMCFVKLPAIYDSLILGYRLGFALAQKDGKWGAILRHYQPIADFIYDEMQISESEITKFWISDKQKPVYIMVKKDGKYGFLNDNAKEIIKPQYEYASFFNREGMAYVKPFGRRGGFIDKNGNEFFEESGIARCEEYYKKKTTEATRLLDVKVSPNPFTAAIVLTCTLKNPSDVQIFVTNSAGQNVFQQNYAFESEGQHSYDLPLEGITAGIYLVTVETKEGRESVKVEKR